MPRYDYHCPANGRTVEVEHGWKERLLSWGEVCVKAGIDPGDTPVGTPVLRLVGMPKIVRKMADIDDSGGGGVTSPAVAPANEDPPRGMHPLDCPCCMPELSPAMKLFHEKLSRSMRQREKSNSDE